MRVGDILTACEYHDLRELVYAPYQGEINYFHNNIDSVMGKIDESKKVLEEKLVKVIHIKNKIKEAQDAEKK